MGHTKNPSNPSNSSHQKHQSYVFSENIGLGFQLVGAIGVAARKGVALQPGAPAN